MREKDLAVVINTLEEEFNIYREVGGEYSAVLSQDVRNGFQKNGKEGTSQQREGRGGETECIGGSHRKGQTSRKDNITLLFFEGTMGNRIAMFYNKIPPHDKVKTCLYSITLLFTFPVL